MARYPNRGGKESDTHYFEGRVFRTVTDPTLSKDLIIGKVFFDTWEYKKRVVEDGLTTYLPIDEPYNKRVAVNAGNWEQVVLKGAELTGGRIANTAKEGKKRIAPPTFLMERNDRVGAFYRRFYGFAQRLMSATTSGETRSALSDRGKALRGIGRDIRGSHDWQYVAELARSQNLNEEDMDSVTSYLLGVDVRTIHLLAGGHNSFLSGVEGRRAYWKEVELPPVYDITGLPIFHISNPFVSFLDHVRGPELAALPRKLIEPRNYRKIEIPEQPETIADALKDVLKHQGITMAREGFVAHLAGSGDVSRMVIVEANGLVFCKGETQYGDLSAVIDKDSATGYFSDLLPEMAIGSVSMEDAAKRTRLGALAARVYRDYLCPEVRVLTGQRPTPKEVGEQEEQKTGRRGVKQRPLSRLIVRDERIGPEQEKTPFTGERIPKFIQVSGYIRAREGGASDETLGKAERWKVQTTLDLPVFDPATEEPIIPYTKPPGMEKLVPKLPEFWRNELQQEAFTPNKGFAPRKRPSEPQNNT